MKPKISVILPAYNAEKYLQKAVQSILAQTYTGFELLIIEDGSTDNTSAIANAAAEKDPRIRILTNPQNLGLTPTLNTGLGEASGEFIARQDADDTSEPNRFALQVEYLQTHSEVGLVGCCNFEMQADGSRRKKSAQLQSPTFADLQQRNYFVHSSVMMRKSVLDKVGFYDPVFTHCEDYELWLRIAKISQCVNLQEWLVTHRKHADSVSAENFKLQTLIAMYAVQMHSDQVSPATHKAIANGDMDALHRQLQTDPVQYHRELAGVCKRYKQYADAHHHYRKLFALGIRNWKVIRNLIVCGLKRSNP